MLALKRFENKIKKIAAKYHTVGHVPLNIKLDTAALSKEVQILRDKFGETLEQQHRRYALQKQPLGIWTVLAFRSSDGSPCTDAYLASHGFKNEFKNTELWNRSKVVASMLQPLLPALKRVRISIFHPQSMTGWHCDDCIRNIRNSHSMKRLKALSLKKKYHTWLRVHVLLSTVDEAQLRIGADKMPPKAGQIFVANVAAPHQVMNKGDERVALLIDVRMQNRKLLKESALGRELLRAQRKLLAQRHMVQAYTRMRIALQEWYHKVPAAERFQIEIHRHKFDQKLWAGPTPPLNSELFSAGDHCGLLGDSEHDLQSYLDHGWTLF